jgi:hypothetical protein
MDLHSPSSFGSHRREYPFHPHSRFDSRSGRLMTLNFSVGILITGFVILKGIFNKITAYMGLLTGILGTAAVAGSFSVDTSIITIITSVMTTLLLMEIQGVLTLNWQPGRVN